MYAQDCDGQLGFHGQLKDRASVSTNVENVDGGGRVGG